MYTKKFEQKYSKTTSRIFVLWSRRRQSPEAN